MLKLNICIIFIILLFFTKNYGLISTNVITNKNYYYITNIKIDNPIIVDTSVGKLEIGNKDEINGMIVYYYSNNLLKSAYLSKEHKIKTKYGKLKIIKVSFYRNGRLKEIKLANPQVIKVNNSNLLVDEISFYENGNIERCYLYFGKQILKTHIGKFNLEDCNYIEFYENGQVKRFKIYIPKKIKTRLGILKVYKEISFYENGKIKSCKLYEPAKIETIIGDLKVSEEIHFYENGELQKCYINEPCVINLPGSKLRFDDIRYFENYDSYNKKYYKNYLLNFEIDSLKINSQIVLTFYKTGELEKIIFFKPNLIYTSLGVFKIDSISYYKSGSIDSFLLDENYGIRQLSNIFITKYIKFYESGYIKKIYLEEPKELYYKDKNFLVDVVSFYENGNIRLINLAENVIINGIKYFKNDVLGFNENGEFLGKMTWDSKIQDYILLKN